MRVWLNRPDNERKREADSDPAIEALLHPAGAFAHPSDVVRDNDLTVNEKRAILASWASDGLCRRICSRAEGLDDRQRGGYV